MDYTSRICWATEAHLRKAGVSTVVISDSRYEDRWKRADAMGADCYLSLHMNGGGGDRAEVYHDYRTSANRGVALALSISGALDNRIPWSVQVKSAGADSRAIRCIRGVRATGIVYEPAFLDGPRVVLLDYCKPIAKALSEGVIAWAWNK